MKKTKQALLADLGREVRRAFWRAVPRRIRRQFEDAIDSAIADAAEREGEAIPYETFRRRLGLK